MIKRFIARLFGKRDNPPAAPAPAAGAQPSAEPSRRGGPAKRTTKPHGKGAGDQPRRYRGTDQGIHKSDVSAAALRTCETLQQGGHRAYIVGGATRDLLLGRRPKDFDVATSATPEQVVKLFRRARMIGRRFQIVHVMHGRDMIEVSTFRAIQPDAQTDEHGRVLRDNVWGTIEDDALRRDFTVNALYYDPVADELLDYHDGVQDLKQKLLRMIGDPAMRYREDPVRMLRSARFAAKLGFKIEPKTRAPIAELATLIQNVPPSRLFDEMLKLLGSGHSIECVRELRAEGLHHGLLPLLDVVLEQPGGERFIEVALRHTDERVAQDKPISPGFLFATLLWQEVRIRWEARISSGEHSIPALMSAIDSVVDEQGEKLAIHKRFVGDMREIWGLQPRFEKKGRGAHRLITHLRFRAAYDFLLIRCEAGDAPAELGQWWTDFIDADTHRRDQLIESGPRSPSPKKRRRRRGGQRRADGEPATDEGTDGGGTDGNDDGSAGDPGGPRSAASDIGSPHRS